MKYPATLASHRFIQNVEKFSLFLCYYYYCFIYLPVFRSVFIFKSIGAVGSNSFMKEVSCIVSNYEQ